MRAPDKKKSFLGTCQPVVGGFIQEKKNTMATTTTSTFVPYITPPPGTVSNPINPASLSYETHITVGISIGFVSLFLLARLYARAVIKKTWILEDCEFLLVL